MLKFTHGGAVAFLFFFATIVSAVASQWTVVNVQQPTYFSHAGDQWKPVLHGMKLPNGTWINTKRGARLLLKRGGDTILINANSLTGITGTSGKNGRVKMRHRKGDVELSIKPGRRDRVRVLTPHVAAVVKGTVFSVSTNKRGSTVAVSRGQVAVSDGRSEETVSVATGESVSAATDVSGLFPSKISSTDARPIKSMFSEVFNPTKPSKENKKGKKGKKGKKSKSKSKGKSTGKSGKGKGKGKSGGGKSGGKSGGGKSGGKSRGGKSGGKSGGKGKGKK